MEARIIFDVGAKPFDWQPIIVAAAIFVGGCISLASQKFKWGRTGIRNVGYFLISLALVTVAYVFIDWQSARRDALTDLANGRYEVVQGTVDHFAPMYYAGRTEESFTVSGHAFRYSDHEMTPCFNRAWAHGGPIHAGLSVRIWFRDSCILRIETAPHQPTSVQN
jgi:hypothetical protein